MSKFRTTRHVLVLLLVVMLMATTASAVFAGNPGEPGDGKADLTVMHRIDGEKLGLEKALPVDLCLNGRYAGTLSYGENWSKQIPADAYTIQIFLKAEKKCAGDPVLSEGPIKLPPGSKTYAKAGLEGKTPVLKYIIYEKK